MVIPLKFAIGVDIGGTNTKVGIVDALGNLYNHTSFQTEARGRDPSLFLSKLELAARELLAGLPVPPVGVGISSHGYLDDAARGPLVCHSTPALKGVDLRGWAEQTFECPARVSNDLIAHALGEYCFGSGRGSHRFMCMAVGTGFGVGVIENGRHLRLVGQTTGDAGRLILESSGPKCNYGVPGSAEALVGVANIQRLARGRYGSTKTAHEIIAAARRGDDPIAVGIIRDIGRYLGTALASLSAMFLPDRVAITGGTAEAGEQLLQACRERFEELAGEYHRILREEFSPVYQGMEIVLGSNRSESGLLGATVEIFQHSADAV